MSNEKEGEGMKKRIGTISYNIYCNFTNYGSALQTWALHQAIKKLDVGVEPVLVDYCPDVLMDKDPLNPFAHMWDQDEESRRLCQLSMPAIRENYEKFDRFYTQRFQRTRKRYTSKNFEDVVRDEALDGFLCGSDTIFCIDEFGGFDDGYYANYPCMKNGYAAAYAASFGDAHFDRNTYAILQERLKNFQALGLREENMLPYVRAHTTVPVQRVLDPTLLLCAEDYAPITAPVQEKSPYLLLYARRYNPQMEAYAERLARENGWGIVEISLRYTNRDRHRMFYKDGVEEYLSLAQHAQYIVTNSFHGAVFAIQFRRPFCVFTREQADTKIKELMDLLALSERIWRDGNGPADGHIDWEPVERRLASMREASLAFLKLETELCPSIGAEKDRERLL